MAARYWVGGSANWDGTAGTKWSATSGGAGGASVPTSADDVFFDANSGASTVTATGTGNPICANLNFTGFTGTFAGSNQVNIYGGLTIVAGMTWTSTSPLVFQATSGSYTVTTAGKTVGSVAFGQAVATTTVWTLGDALTSSSSFTVNSGTVTTNNFNVTATQLSSSNTNTRTINLGSSTVTLTSSANIIVNFSTNTNLTFNAGTSTISASGTTTIISGGGAAATGVTFNNVSFTATSATTHQIQGINTFNNITVTAPSAAGVTQFTFDSRQTINGTLSTTGTAGNRRVWFRSSTYGIAQTLTINSAPSLTDADFRDIYVIGTATPISGTRIGDLRGIRGITASTPKTVYWNLAGTQNWSANGWATTSTGTPSTDNFPLAQDTATFTNAGSVTGTITMDAAIPYTGTVDMSGRTSAMTLSIATGFTIYGDWTNGSGVSIGGTGGLTFSGRNIQTITSAGRTFSGAITVDSYGGTVQLADALNIGSQAIAVTNGTFDTKNFNVTAGSLSSSNSNVRTITLGSSTVTLSSNPIAFATNTNLTFNAGTSSIVSTAASGSLVGGSSTTGVTFYDVSFTSNAAGTPSINGVNTFRNLTVGASTAAGLTSLFIQANQTITGTLTVAGATAVRRIFVRSDTLGTTRTLTVNSLSATDCDFRDITIAGAAAGSSPTRAGNCGGNTGITFPSPKTVYWNSAVASLWSSTAWAPASGGTPDINQFPLAQDTAVFDNAGTVAGAIAMDASWNIGTFDASARTSAMTLTTSASTPFVYGNWRFGTGVTSTSTSGTITFAGRSTQTITSNGVTFGCPVTVDCVTSTVQLADALTLGSTRTLTLTSGTFDAVTYNVTTGLFNCTTGTNTILRMGSGTWTLSGTGNIWMSTASPGTFFKGTANIVLSDTSTTSRAFNGSALSYNKLTIGGATGTSTLTISSNNQFTELASTKTVAHTIDFGSTAQTFGKWTVTGTAGNVVTLSGTGTSHVLAGAATSGIDYLAMGSIGFSSTSPGEFYAGANSTGTASAPVFRTAPPAARTLYWVGGTGNWSSTTKWSTSSGGGSGAAVPTSLDNVIFDAASNATAYTATIDATSRCNQLTIAGPASGNVTLAGSSTLICHGNITLPATGLTRTFTGPLVLSGSVTGDTLTTNGVTLASAIEVNGVGCEWTLGSALNNGSSAVTVTNGNLLLSTYNLTADGVTSNNGNSRTINLGSSTVALSGSIPINFGSSETNRAALTVTAGTSQINSSSASPSLLGNNQTFYNVSFTSTSSGTISISGTNSFNNLSFTGITTSGLKNIPLAANQTVTGTFTLSAGSNAALRHFVRSDTIGTTRTLTCAAVSFTDADFRDITIAGAAAPVSGTRLGDCKGNSGITFPAAKTVYWNLAGNNNWSATGWAASSGGSPAVNNFPLAQDTAVFEATSPGTGTTTTINAAYNIGTIDMSARTANTMTLATNTSPTIYGNWINGTGTTLSGGGGFTFAGRGSQTITSAGKTFPQQITINTPSGSVTLQDAFATSNVSGAAFLITQGTFDANTYNVSITAGGAQSTGTLAKTIAFGSGTWTIAAVAGWAATGSNLTVTGTGTISLTNASSKSFVGGGVAYTNITLNQGGAGALIISNDNTFKDITNTYSATGAANITIGTTTQTVTQWTGTGTVGKVLTVQGTSASSPGTLILSSGSVNVDYLTITGVRAYNLSTTWYAGANSTNNGSLGWIFSAAPAAASTGNFFLFFNPF